MELTDSIEAATRSPLGIDLNEIPASSSSLCPTSAAAAEAASSSSAAASAANLDRSSGLDSLDVVRSFRENSDPAAGFPGQEETGTACGACAENLESGGEVMVCDGCERGFHLACSCAGETLAAPSEEWICAECTDGGVKSKRWPLGVKRKQILDINASPPSDADGEGADELLDLRRCIRGGNMSGADANGGLVTHSNILNMGNGFSFRNGSGFMMHALRAGFEDMLHRAWTTDRSIQEVDLGFPLLRFSRSNNNTAVRLQSRNPSEIFLEGLREFISERHGVLEEGWHVELKQSVSDHEVYAVYCSPDGKTFGSMSEVACHLGLMSNNCTVMDTNTRGDGCPSLQERLHLPKKRKSKRFSLSNGFSENKESLVNGYHEKIAFHGQNTQLVDHGPGKVFEADMEVDDYTRSQQSNEGLPVQFEDFFVLSLGKIDIRPAYHDVSQIWPVGYRSCWHDRVTGSLFMCQVLDGGDSGPLFRVSRFPCSVLPLPRGSTVLYRTTVDQSIREDNKGNNTFFDSMDCGNDSCLEDILAEPSPPTECDILSCLSSGDINGFRTSDCMQSDILHNRSQNLHSSNMALGDEIGEISAEHCSSSAAWKLVCQNLIDAFSKTCKQRDSFKFYCNHVDDEMDSSTWNTQEGRNVAKFSSLAKFCSWLGFVEIPLECEPDTLATALLKWLEQDRFGLDAEFVQKMTEQLPGVEACIKYEFRINRRDPSISLTVGNGLLMAKRKRGAKSDEALQWSKYPRLVEGLEVDDDSPPPGTPLCSRLPSVLAGEFYQVWELLWRFHETLGLKDPFPLEELEEELSNPCHDDSYPFDNLESRVHENQVLHLHNGDRVIGQLSSSCDESSMTVGGDNSQVFVPVETRVMKDATQSRIASIKDSGFFGVALTEAHSSLLSVLISELQLKVAAIVHPNSDPGEWKTKRGRRKDADSSTIVRRSKLHMLPINELTWPELARRYILAFLSMDGNLDSTEISARESGKVFCCLQGDGGSLCGSLTGVAGMEADALLLAEAMRKIFGSLTKERDVLTLEDEVMDAGDACVENNVNDGDIPEWARSLEPVRKLPTNVGTRIRKCVYDALEKKPPEWAQKRLEYSISKEVYKGNASGPTKKAVLSVLADVLSERLAQKSDKRIKRKIDIPISDITMKQCRIILRHAAAADDARAFCTLLGRNLINSSENDDEGLLGSPAMVSRPLDFRTIDLRLAVGAYGGSHESFLEDVRELWNNVRIAFGDQPDLVELAETLSQKFELLYEKEVVSLVHKFEGYAKLDHISIETKREIDCILASTNEIPKAPWDEGVCKVCGVDKDDDSVLLCDACDAEYHTYCLNPPLARIPKGNWYCPFCVVGEHVLQGATGNTPVIGQGHYKKYKGEVTRCYLETLAHLAVAMEEKEYWECSVDERVFLLKFLCDELLSSALIRQHLEQCAETTAELQQKLRSFLVEWKNLKSKAEFLASRAAKMSSTVGDTALQEGLPSVHTSQGKGQPTDLSDRPGHASTFFVDQPALEGDSDGKGTNGLNKEDFVITNSDKNYGCGNKNLSYTDIEHQKDSDVISDTNVFLQENVNSSGKNQSQQVIGGSSVVHFDGNLQGFTARSASFPVQFSDDKGFSLSSENNVHVSQHGSPAAMNESEAYHFELSSVKNEILHLQNSITSTELQLMKQYMRREFLGCDSGGRLYWASATPDMHSQVIVGGSLTLQHGEKSGHKDYFPFLDDSIDPMAACSEWFSYKTDAEIEKLINWLKDDDRKERELKNSILQWMKLRFQERQLNEDHVPKEGLSMTVKNDQTASSCLFSKAFAFLEKKYGACLELDTKDLLRKQVEKARVTGKERMYRCDCLELIRPSKHHCSSCHRTFPSEAELAEHNNVRCNLVPPVLEKGEEINDLLKLRFFKRSASTRVECPSEKNTAETSRSGQSELKPTSIRFQDEGMARPYGFQDISSKFVTVDSNKELVQQIGLIGSNGILSFITAVSPYFDDSTLSLISCQKDGTVQGRESNVDETTFSQGNRSETDLVLQNLPDDSARKFAANEINKALETKKSPSVCLERNKKKRFADRSFPQLTAGCCCVAPWSSLRPLFGKVLLILRQLKINLLDMESALPEEGLKASRAPLERRLAWRWHVKSAMSIYEMVQATIVLAEMIKAEYLRNEWWYWSSLSAAVKTSTIASLALRIYSLDAAILYDKAFSNSDPTSSLQPSSMVDQKSLPGLDSVDKSKASRKSTRKRKEPEG